MMLYRKEFCSGSKCSDMYKPSGSRQQVKSFFRYKLPTGVSQARPFTWVPFAKTQFGQVAKVPWWRGQPGMSAKLATSALLQGSHCCTDITATGRIQTGVQF